MLKVIFWYFMAFLLLASSGMIADMANNSVIVYKVPMTSFYPTIVFVDLIVGICVFFYAITRKAE